MRTKTYTEQLEALYRGTKEGEESLSKLEFLSCYIFDFTTYDSGMDKIFAQKMLDVIECILNKTNFQYIEASNENYLNYLTMINMPFLKDKLDWGTSIRGAWFNLDNDCSIRLDEILIPKGADKIELFMGELLKWAK
jgi:hypothetical protein